MSKTSPSAGVLRQMHESDLEPVLNWRNHLDVRRHMLHADVITWESHVAWFTQASQDCKRRLLVYEVNEQICGFVSFFEVVPGIAEWGFHTSPDAESGTGTRMLRLALLYGFADIGLQRIYARVLAHNTKSLRVHERLGFLQEGLLRRHHFDGNSYQSIIFFGILSSEWNAKKVKF